MLPTRSRSSCARSVMRRMAAVSRTDPRHHIERLVREFFAFDVRQGTPPEDQVAVLVRLRLDPTWDETILVYCGGPVRVYVFMRGKVYATRDCRRTACRVVDGGYATDGACHERGTRPSERIRKGGPAGPYTTLGTAMPPGVTTLRRRCTRIERWSTVSTCRKATRGGTPTAQTSTSPRSRGVPSARVMLATRTTCLACGGAGQCRSRGTDRARRRRLREVHTGAGESARRRRRSGP